METKSDLSSLVFSNNRAYGDPLASSTAMETDQTLLTTLPPVSSDPGCSEKTLVTGPVAQSLGQTSLGTATSGGDASCFGSNISVSCQERDGADDRGAPANLTQHPIVDTSLENKPATPDNGNQNLSQHALDDSSYVGTPENCLKLCQYPLSEESLNAATTPLSQHPLSDLQESTPADSHVPPGTYSAALAEYPISDVSCENSPSGDKVTVEQDCKSLSTSVRSQSLPDANTLEIRYKEHHNSDIVFSALPVIDDSTLTQNRLEDGMSVVNFTPASSSKGSQPAADDKCQEVEWQRNNGEAEDTPAHDVHPVEGKQTENIYFRAKQRSASEETRETLVLRPQSSVGLPSRKRISPIGYIDADTEQAPSSLSCRGSAVGSIIQGEFSDSSVGEMFLHTNKFPLISSTPFCHRGMSHTGRPFDERLSDSGRASSQASTDVGGCGTVKPELDMVQVFYGGWEISDFMSTEHCDGQLRFAELIGPIGNKVNTFDKTDVQRPCHYTKSSGSDSVISDKDHACDLQTDHFVQSEGAEQDNCTMSNGSFDRSQSDLSESSHLITDEVPACSTNTSDSVLSAVHSFCSSSHNSDEVLENAAACEMPNSVGSSMPVVGNECRSEDLCQFSEQHKGLPDGCNMEVDCHDDGEEMHSGVIETDGDTETEISKPVNQIRQNVESSAITQRADMLSSSLTESGAETDDDLGEDVKRILAKYRIRCSEKQEDPCQEMISSTTADCNNWKSEPCENVLLLEADDPLRLTRHAPGDGSTDDDVRSVSSDDTLATRVKGLIDKGPVQLDGYRTGMQEADKLSRSDISYSSACSSHSGSVDYSSLSKDLDEIQMSLESLRNSEKTSLCSRKSSFGSQSTVSVVGLTTAKAEHSFTDSDGDSEVSSRKSAQRNASSLVDVGVTVNPLLTSGVIPMDVALDLLHGVGDGHFPSADHNSSLKDLSVNDDNIKSGSHTSTIGHHETVLSSSVNGAFFENAAIRSGSASLLHSSVEPEQVSKCSRLPNGKTPSDNVKGIMADGDGAPQHSVGIAKVYSSSAVVSDSVTDSSWSHNSLGQNTGDKLLLSGLKTAQDPDIDEFGSCKHLHPDNRALGGALRDVGREASLVYTEESERSTVEDVHQDAYGESAALHTSSHVDDERSEVGHGRNISGAAGELSSLTSERSFSEIVRDVLERGSPTRQAYEYLREAEELKRAMAGGSRPSTALSSEYYLSSSMCKDISSDSFGFSPLPKHSPFNVMRDIHPVLTSQLNRAVTSEFDRSIELRSPFRQPATFHVQDLEAASDCTHDESNTDDGDETDGSHVTLPSSDVDRHEVRPALANRYDRGDHFVSDAGFNNQPLISSSGVRFAPLLLSHSANNSLAESVDERLATDPDNVNGVDLESDLNTARSVPESMISHLSSVSTSVNRTQAVDMAGLRPYIPGGSNEICYVDSGGEEMSVAAVSETTVESTHPGSDDAKPPNFPAHVLGSRAEAPAGAEGIYSKRSTSASVQTSHTSSVEMPGNLPMRNSHTVDRVSPSGSVKPMSLDKSRRFEEKEQGLLKTQAWVTDVNASNERSRTATPNCAQEKSYPHSLSCVSSVKMGEDIKGRITSQSSVSPLPATGQYSLSKTALLPVSSSISPSASPAFSVRPGMSVPTDEIALPRTVLDFSVNDTMSDRTVVQLVKKDRDLSRHVTPARVNSADRLATVGADQDFCTPVKRIDSSDTVTGGTDASGYYCHSRDKGNKEHCLNHDIKSGLNQNDHDVVGPYTHPLADMHTPTRKPEGTPNISDRASTMRDPTERSKPSAVRTVSKSDVNSKCFRQTALVSQSVALGADHVDGLRCSTNGRITESDITGKEICHREDWQSRRSYVAGADCNNDSVETFGDSRPCSKQNPLRKDEHLNELWNRFNHSHASANSRLSDTSTDSKDDTTGKINVPSARNDQARSVAGNRVQEPAEPHFVAFAASGGNNAKDAKDKENKQHKISSSDSGGQKIGHSQGDEQLVTWQRLPSNQQSSSDSDSSPSKYIDPKKSSHEYAETAKKLKKEKSSYEQSTATLQRTATAKSKTGLPKHAWIVRDETLPSVPEDTTLDSVVTDFTSTSSIDDSGKIITRTTKRHLPNDPKLLRLQQKIAQQREKHRLARMNELRRREQFLKLERAKADGQETERRHEHGNGKPVGSQQTRFSDLSSSSAPIESSTLTAEDSDVMFCHQSKSESGTNESSLSEMSCFGVCTCKQSHSVVTKHHTSPSRQRALHSEPRLSPKLNFHEVDYKRGQASQSQHSGKSPTRQMSSSEKRHLKSPLSHGTNAEFSHRHVGAKRRHQPYDKLCGGDKSQNLHSTSHMNSKAVQTTPRLNAGDQMKTRQCYQSVDASSNVHSIGIPFNGKSPSRARNIASHAFSPDSSSDVIKTTTRSGKLKTQSKVVHHFQPGLAWFVPFDVDGESSQCLKQIQEQLNLIENDLAEFRGQHDSVYEDDKENRFGILTDQRLHSDPLQENTHKPLWQTFRENMGAFISRSRERQRYVLLRAEERHMQELEADERERLFGIDRHVSASTAVDPNAEQLFRPRKRSFGKKEMKDLTNKHYRKLPEVTYAENLKKKIDAQRLNRLRVKIYAQKTLHRLFLKKSS